MKLKTTLAATLAASLLLPVATATAQQSKTMAQQTMTVEELFGLVESGSRTLRAQKTGVEVASHAVSAAKSQRLPEVETSLSASYNGNVLMTDRDFGNARGLSSPHFGNSFSLQAQQVVYAGGAINTGIRMAELQRRQAEVGVSQTRNEQRFMALGQYLDLFKIDNALRVYDQNIALTRRLIDDIKAKQQQGMALKNDVTRYELQMETLLLGKRKLEDNRSILNHQLCNTLDIDQCSITPDSRVADAALADASEQDWQLRATASSPRLQQSALGTKLAEEQVTMAKSALLPKVAVVAADNFSGPFTYDLPPIDKNFNVWYVGVGVKYSLSSLFKGNKEVRRTKAALRQSNEAHAATAESLDNQVQAAHTLYLQSQAELRTEQKSVELAGQNYRVMNERYLNQLALVTDMVDASNVKLSAELREVDARVNIVYAYYKLKYITGEI